VRGVRLPALVALLAVVAGAVVAPSAASADVGGPDIVSFLNAQRAANGIPAGITEDAAQSSACAAHDNYGRLNGVLVHDEDPAKPGYTAAGRTAAQTSVLYQGAGPWSAARNPFETAPIHLHQLLAPRIDKMGAAETQGWGCATTFFSRNRPAPAANIAYTYPGDGATGWMTSEVAAEGPYTPGQQVGIPAGTRTGPYLYVSFDGPALDPFAKASGATATLMGPEGPVDVAVVDNTTNGVGDLLPTGMEVIPRAALRPDASYTASVSATVTPWGGGAAMPFTFTWSFTTGGKVNAVAIPAWNATGAALAVSVRSTAPGATVTATGPGTAASGVVGAVGGDGTGTAALTLDRAGTWHVCAASGGTGTGWAAASACVDVAAGADPVVAPVVVPPVAFAPPPKAVVRPVAPASFASGVKARLRGRALTVPVRCAAACALKVTATVTAGKRTSRVRAVKASRTKAGTVTVRFVLSKMVARRLRAARVRRVALTVVTGGTTLRKTLSVTTR
jgi:hypothetical protein